MRPVYKEVVHSPISCVHLPYSRVNRIIRDRRLRALHHMEIIQFGDMGGGLLFIWDGLSTIAAPVLLERLAKGPEHEEHP